jgi:hypothetical protein
MFFRTRTSISSQALLLLLRIDKLFSICSLLSTPIALQNELFNLLQWISLIETIEVTKLPDLGKKRA